MATNTMLKVVTDSAIFHRVELSNDLPQTDVDTSDVDAQNLSGEGEFEISATTAATHVTTESKVQTTTAAAIGAATTITKYIFIKHSGFQDALKTTASAASDTLKVYLHVSGGAKDDNQYVTIAKGEAIFLHGLGSLCNALNLISLEAVGNSAYVEITYI